MAKLFLLKCSGIKFGESLAVTERVSTMPKSKSEKASYIQEWRKNSYKEKRFNKPMREYFELKHRDNYNEYCLFFKALHQKHPNVKDLTKTSTYKSWKRRQLNCESSDEETGPAEPAETGPAAPIETGPAEAIETGPIEPAETDHPDPLTAAMQETLPPDIENININQVDAIIQQVINELQQDEVIHELFNDDELVQDNDEGIDLDVETELEAIIEPFDYELEVDF